MSATQMNFRIDADLKAAGNLALGENGLTPTEIVRDTWQFLARNRHAPDAIRKLVDYLRGAPLAVDGAGDGGSSARDDTWMDDLEDDVVMKGPRIIEHFYKEMGIDPSTIEPMSYEELKFQAYADKYPEILGVS